MFSFNLSPFWHNNRRIILSILGLCCVSTLILVIGVVRSNANTLPSTINGGIFVVSNVQMIQNSTQKAYFSEDIIEQLLTHHEMGHVYPILSTKTIFQEHGIEIWGVTQEFLNEEKKSTDLQQGETDAFMNEPSLIMGDAIAARAHVSIGDRVVVRSQSFRVIAVLNRTNTEDDLLTYAFLPTLQKATDHNNMINRVVVHSSDSKQYKAAESIITQDYPDLSIEESLDVSTN